jgi:hypothetical protein
VHPNSDRVTLRTEMPAYPPLPSCTAPTICASNALVAGLSALRLRVAGNCPNCVRYVFDKIGSQSDQALFSQFINRRAKLLDGTRSTLLMQNISGDMATSNAQSMFLQYLGSGTTVAATFAAHPDLEALAVFESVDAQSPTGTKGLTIFFNPSNVCTNSALTSGSSCQFFNQSVIFHEGLHEYYDLGDAAIQRLFLLPVLDNCSANMSDYITYTLFNLTSDSCTP